MKKFFSILLAGAFLPLFGNMLTNGSLENEGRDPQCSRFTTDRTPVDGISCTKVKREDGKSVIRMSSTNPKGTAQVTFRQVTKLEKGVTYYLTFNYDLKSYEPGGSLLIVVHLKDAAGKTIRSYWGTQVNYSKTGLQEHLHTVRVNEDAEKAEVIVYFRGIFSADAFDFNLDRNPPQNPVDGNLFWNPSFENSALPGFYPTPRKGNSNYRGEGLFTFGRRQGEARTGEYSYYVKNDQPDCSMLINITLPFAGQQRYRFSCWGKVISGTGRISASVGFVDAAGKVTYRYPRMDTTVGDWRELKDEFYAPEGTVGFRILFWVAGQIEVYLDDFFLGPAEQDQKKKDRSDTSFLITSSAQFTLWQDAAYLKPDMTGIPAGMRQISGVSISCAGNESEPFTLTLNPKVDLPQVDVQFSDLTCGDKVIAKSNLSWRRVGYIHMQDAEYNPTLKGWSADPLFPGRPFDAQAGKNLSMFITVAVPDGQAPGVYTGKVKIVSNGQTLAEVPLSIQVRNFSIPTTPHLRNFFYAWANQPPYRQFDTRPLDEVWTNFEVLFKEHRFVGNQAKHPPIPKWEIQDGNLVITDFSHFDEVITRWYDYGMRYFVVPPLNFLGHYHGWIQGRDTIPQPGKSPFCDESWVSENGLKYAAQFAKQYMDHVRVKFPNARFYAYIFDEPQPAAYADLAKITTALHEAAPDLNIFITKDYTDGIGPVQSWCVPLAPGLVHLDQQRAHQARGGEIWYYNWTVCMDDHDYIRTRLYPWQIYCADGDGGLLWNTISMPAGINPWTQMDKTHKIGAATVFYPPVPGSDGIVPSLRSIALKESIDDFDYMTILEQEIDRRFPGCGRNRVKEIIAEMIYDMPFEFHNDLTLLYRLRSKLADEIEALKNAPVSMVASIPAEHSSVELTNINFTVYGPAGAVVTIDGRNAGTIPADGKLAAAAQLTKVGKNEVKITVSANGKTREFIRTYTLMRDPNLAALEALCTRNAAETALIAPIRQFLQRTANNPVYTQQDRETAARLLTETKRALLRKQLANIPAFINDVQRRFFERAVAAEKAGCYDRAEYYLNLAARAASAQTMRNFKVRLIPSECQGHPGFVLDNGIISVGFTETAGRIYSFKVRGVETLHAGDFSNALDPLRRMQRQVTGAMVQHHVDYAGYSDEAAMGHWPEALVDWDIELIELTPEKITVAVSTTFFDKPFRFKRFMTVRADSPDLELRYEIFNIMPPGQVSEDPAHYQFAWRGRFVPAIGADGAQNDVLYMPAADIQLPTTVFDTGKPAFYERPNFRLALPRGGAFDPASGIGFVMLGDQNITHGYIWFNSRGNHKGEGKRYTLEFPRSKYGLASTATGQNTPFNILPGQTVRFTLKLRGLENIRSQADLESRSN